MRKGVKPKRIDRVDRLSAALSFGDMQRSSQSGVDPQCEILRICEGQQQIGFPHLYTGTPGMSLLPDADCWQPLSAASKSICRSASRLLAAWIRALYASLGQPGKPNWPRPLDTLTTRPPAKERIPWCRKQSEAGTLW